MFYISLPTESIQQSNILGDQNIPDRQQKPDKSNGRKQSEYRFGKVTAHRTSNGT